jgi:hypothetical protein
MDTTPADRVRAAIADARTLTDPAERARIITEVLDVIADTAPALRADRQADVIVLRSRPMTFAAIGDLIGVTRGRVEQITKGR